MAELLPAYRLFIVLGISCGAFSSNVSMTNFISYPACSKDMVLRRNILEMTTATSLLDCSRKCATRGDCLAINVCKTNTRQRGCELLGKRNNGCSGMVTRLDCKYREKEFINPCQNGGTYVESKPCICVPGWADTYCQRLVKDCKEANSSGLSMERLTLIQPLNCPYAFEVYCSVAGATYGLRRNEPFSDPDGCDGKVLDPNMTMKGYQDQFGSVKCDYLIGLEQIWYLLKQGTYTLNLFLQYYSDPSNDTTLKTDDLQYWNFKMASKEDGYAIQYSGTNAGANDGLKLMPYTPTKFCTHDQDCGTCAKDKGVAWWYNPNCDNYPLTKQNGTTEWPLDGEVRTLSLAVIQFF